MTNQPQWILLLPNEDCNPIIWLTEDKLEHVLANADEYGITRWVTPDNWKDEDPNYWEDGDAMLIKIGSIALPREVAYKYSID